MVSDIILALLLTGMLAFSFNTNAVMTHKPDATASGAPAAVKVIPEIIELGPQNVTDLEFTVAIVVEGITDLAGFDIQLEWNTTCLDYVGHSATVPVENFPPPQEPSPYGGILHEPILTLKNEVNQTAGTYWVAFATFDGPSFNGSGTVFIMTFKVAHQPQQGEEDVTLHLHFTVTALSDPAPKPIPHDVYDGTVIIHAHKTHDVAITNITTPETVVGQNYTTFINVTVENQGGYNENINITTYANTTTIDTLTNMILAEGNNTTIVFAWNTTGWLNGNYTISATITPVSGETDTADNTYVDGVVTVISFAHDVAVVNVTAFKTIVGQEFFLSINVTVENQGGYNENINITTYANTTVIDTLAGISLNTGNSLTIIFTWDTTGWTKGNYTISTRVERVPGETDTADNTFADGLVLVTIPGDVDGDFDVDIYDVVKMCSAYGYGKGDPEYDPNCDTDSDGYVDIFDIVIACSHYGEQHP